jgi:hypothetical protein
MSTLNLLGPLWRLCTNFSYRSCPGGIQGLQNPGAQFESATICRKGRSPSGKATDCNPVIAGSIPALPSKVVRPKL